MLVKTPLTMQKQSHRSQPPDDQELSLRFSPLSFFFCLWQLRILASLLLNKPTFPMSPYLSTLIPPLSVISPTPFLQYFSITQHLRH